MKLLRAGAVLASILAATATVVFWGSARWRRRTRDALVGLRYQEGKGGVRLPATFSPDELVGLPDPVTSYFAFALRAGQPIIRGGRIRQKGQFAARPGKWVPFTAEEHFRVSPPAFLWDARIHMAPLVDVLVRDAYESGRGSMHGALAGVLDLVRLAGTPEMAEASLLRYLAEAAWFPTALLPSAGVRWDPLDETSARATLIDAGVEASMDAHFAPDGSLSRIRAFRHRDVNGEPVLTPWIGRFGDYRRVENMMVPGLSEIGWVIEGEWHPYWRGRGTAYHLDYVERAGS